MLKTRSGLYPNDPDFKFSIGDIYHFTSRDAGFFLEVLEILVSKMHYDRPLTNQLFLHLNQLMTQKEFAPKRPFVLKVLRHHLNTLYKNQLLN